MNISNQIKQAQEKILNEGHPELKTSPQFYQNGEWVQWVNIWVRRISKENAIELKSLLEPLQSKSRQELMDIFDSTYRHWVSQHTDCSFNVEKQEFKILGGGKVRNFVEGLSDFVQELEKIISKEHDDIEEKKWVMNCSECSQQFICAANSEELAIPKLEEEFKTHYRQKHRPNSTPPPPQIPLNKK